MSAPFYTLTNQQHPEKRPDHSNTGLWYTRFYNRFDKDWSVGDDDKGNWIDAVTGFCGDHKLLELAGARGEKLAKALNAEIAEFKTDANFVSGLGLSHPVENGFTWHHTLGVPYLPASGVKGLLRGWVEAWMTHQDEDKHKTMTQRWFGMAKGSDSVADHAGGLIFFDALPTAPVQLVTEIMTPHAGKWYEQGGDIASVADYADKAPADWHSPVPVPFLAVGRGASFRFMIAPRLTGDAAVDALARQDCRDAMAQLALALEWMGAGAKTATGYGRMALDVQAIEIRKAEEKAKYIAELAPIERAKAELAEMNAKQLKELFGKQWNKKVELEKENAHLWITTANELHENTIKKWSALGKNEDKLAYKAYRRLMRQDEEDA